MRPGICRTYSLRHGHEAEVGAARGERHAERLAFADRDVGAAVRPFAGWFQ
jgi:hypothetical protein